MKFKWQFIIYIHLDINTIVHNQKQILSAANTAPVCSSIGYRTHASDPFVSFLSSDVIRPRLYEARTNFSGKHIIF